MSDYLAFAGDRTWKRCDTPAEANEWLSQVGGGRVFVDLKRFAAAEALDRDYQEVRDRLDAANARLAAAETRVEGVETRYEELRELIACGSRSMAHEDLVSQLRVNNELIVTRDQKVADARQKLADAEVDLAELRKQLPRILDAPRNDEADRVWMAWALRLKAAKGGRNE